MIAAAADVVAVGAIGMGGGYWISYQAGVTKLPVFSQMEPAEASMWSHVIADNEGVGAAAMKTCETSIAIAANGRCACNLPVWVDPVSLTMPAIRR